MRPLFVRVCRASRHAPALVLCLALGAAGCGGPAAGKLYPVAGKVSVAGAPLTQGGVRFQPDRDRGNTTPAEPVGQIRPDGTFMLTTNGRPGAPAGWYKVAVSAGAPVDSTRPFAAKSPVAWRYANPDASGLSVEVGPAAGAYDLNVSSR